MNHFEFQHYHKNTNPFTKLLNRFSMLMCILTCFLLLSCKDTTSASYDESRINEIMYNVENAFNNHDIDALMLNFSSEYLHNGQAKWEIEEVWLNRMGQYLLIDFQNIEIDVHDDEAMVSFRMKLTNATETVYIDEPATHGDLSYFFYNNSDWVVYGNQHQ